MCLFSLGLYGTLLLGLYGSPLMGLYVSLPLGLYGSLLLGVYGSVLSNLYGFCFLVFMTHGSLFHVLLGLYGFSPRVSIAPSIMSLWLLFFAPYGTLLLSLCGVSFWVSMAFFSWVSMGLLS